MANIQVIFAHTHAIRHSYVVLIVQFMCTFYILEQGQSVQLFDDKHGQSFSLDGRLQEYFSTGA